MTHLLVLGTNHKLQCGHKSIGPESVKRFERELQQLCAKHSIRRIAEEMCQDGLAFHEVSATVAGRVATELCLEHQHVDLNHSERSVLCIDDSPVLTTVMHCSPSDGGACFRDAMNIIADGVRERVWVSRLLTMKSWPCLFVCGADHVQPVRRLWASIGLEATVACRDYVA